MSHHQIDKSQWIDLNEECITIEKNEITFTTSGPKDPPPLNIEINLNPPLKEIKNVEIKVDFEQPRNSSASWSAPSWSGEWIEAVPNSTVGAKYKVVDYLQEDDMIYRIHLRLSSYKWGARCRKTHNSGQNAEI